MRLSYCSVLLSTFFILLLSVQSVAETHAGGQNILTDSINFESSILEDTNKIFSIYDVTSTKIDRLFRKPISADLLKTDGVFWIKFSIKKNSPEPVFLETRATHRSTIFFIPLGDGRYTIQRDGFNYPFKEKRLKVNSTIFPITRRGVNKNYYVRIELSSFWGPSIYLNSFERIFNVYIRNYFFDGLILGFIFFTCLYGLVFWILVKEKAYFYYACYVLSFALFIVTEKDFEVYFTQYLNIPFKGFFYSIPFSLMTIFLLLYAQCILNTKKYLPAFHRLLNGFIIVKILFLFTGNIVEISNNPIFDDSFILVAFIAAVLRLRQGFKPARYVVLGLSVILLGILFQGFRFMLFSINPFWDLFSVQNVCIGEIILFYFALASRVKTLKAEKENAFIEAIHGLKENELLQKEIIHQLKENELLKEKVNRELEDKVKERTNQISEMAVEIEKMNQLLKVENTTLYTNVKKLSKARVMQNPVSFEEFKNIYPDEEACNKFLVELKWGKGFVCRKCANTKFYIKANFAYTYVCSICKYAESPTASTIFNRLKFPIEKAFYILFLLSAGKKITSEQLSQQVELRKQTCWLFKKKVFKVMEKTQYLKTKAGDWTHLILHS